MGCMRFILNLEMCNIVLFERTKRKIRPTNVAECLHITTTTKFNRKNQKLSGICLKRNVKNDKAVEIKPTFDYNTIPNAGPH